MKTQEQNQAQAELNEAGRNLRNQDVAEVLKDNVVSVFVDMYGSLGALAVLLVGLNLITKEEVAQRMQFISDSVKDI